MAVTTMTDDLQRARTMLAQGENKKASRLLTDVAIACRDADQAREIKRWQKRASPAPACSARPSGRKSSGSPRFAGRSNGRLLRRDAPSTFHASRRSECRPQAGGQGCGRSSLAAMRRIVSEP